MNERPLKFSSVKVKLSSDKLENCLAKKKVIGVVEVMKVYNLPACSTGSVSPSPPPQKDQIIRFGFERKMVKLAKLLFLIFSTASPKPFLLLNNNSSMDMEVNPNTSPVVLFKSSTLPTKTSSFSTKLNPLLIKPKLPKFKEP